MEYNLNDKNISTTYVEYDSSNNKKTVNEDIDLIEKDWTMDKYFDSDFTAEKLIDTLSVIEKFKRRFPNDKMVKDFELVVREELCNMFGGTIFDFE